MRIELDAPEDPRIAAFRNLKEGVSVRQGQFIAEGHWVVRMLLSAPRYRCISLLISTSRVDSLADLLAHVPPETPVFVASSAVLEAIAGYDVHRGCLALGTLQTPWTDEDTFGGPVVLMEGISNHDNVGGIFRNVAALGGRGVIIDPTTADPMYRKAIRVSMGSVFVTPWQRRSMSDAIRGARARGYRVVALTPAADAKPLRDAFSGHPAERTVLVVGSEGAGLSSEVMHEADVRACIPMTGRIDSLNAATSCAVALYELNFSNGLLGCARP